MPIVIVTPDPHPDADPGAHIARVIPTEHPTRWGQAHMQRTTRAGWLAATDQAGAPTTAGVLDAMTSRAAELAADSGADTTLTTEELDEVLAAVADLAPENGES
ncbi:hypothetical protein [Streptomyces sp. ST2-7A]|uniref:hypothetical protein n=1 Tax=Streptomyces sp. ST2-7A TaxID=2907214 RepID=UPI001F26E30B|nr:hypothetical protein [Streptomyces sp. ST2-7A]MCE7081151.1 hypothetical protein [Streptomyces sp. ST2-7A]